MKWSNTHRLLLVYKDDLVEQKGLLSSGRRSESLTLERHLKLAIAGQEPSAQASLFDFARYDHDFMRRNERYFGAVPSQCCVWGWWRKPWESHEELFVALKTATQGDEKPVAYLYNQYLRRLYKSTVHDAYFEVGLTSVVVPAIWRDRCPEYYRDTRHLCGAFFALDIDPKELDAKDLQKLFVDASSFEFETQTWPTVAPPPEDSVAACRSMIDSVPRRASLRVSESTLLVLRPTKQKDYTAALIRRANFDDRDLADSLRDTAWTDVLEVLSHASPITWDRLSVCPNAIMELGRKARESGSRLTRLDFELVAQACASSGLRELIEVGNGNDERSFTQLGLALRRWVTTSEEKEARREAAAVFKNAWLAATERYQVAPLNEKYFNYLPAMEAVASAVRHELGKKFYRDHLSHNVRAALLSARLTENTAEAKDPDLNDRVVAFFSGLFHDIALPVTTFPDTVGNLAAALSTIQIADGTPPYVPSILNRHRLRRSLAYVALLASTPNVSRAFPEEMLAPWSNPDQALRNVDKNLLFEELLCAATDEHALTSAALLFDAAVRGSKGDIDFDSGVRSLLGRMTGPTSEARGRELAAILQSMALHDRKPAALYHGVDEPSINTPKALNWPEFQMPIIVMIADEFQEWGRTVGAIEGLGAVDASIDLKPGKVCAKVVLSDNASTFASVPFSLLESMLGKVRNVGKLTYSYAGGTRPFNVSVTTENLRAFRLSYASPGVGTKITFKEGYEFMSLSMIDSQRSNEVHGDHDSELVRIVVDASESPGRDYLLLLGDRSLLDRCVNLGKQRVGIQELTLGEGRVRLVCSDHSVIDGTIESYRFGDLGSDSAPRKQFPSQGPISVLRITVTGVNSSAADLVLQRPQMTPAPHFLDNDWRFTERTARLISDYCTTLARNLGGEICFLGCPTVALWHSKHNAGGPEWSLLDKGHFALEKWLHGQIPPERFVRFDAFAPLDIALQNKFAVVIADPPWYEDEYQAFWQRAQTLAKQNGIIGITYYPPTLDVNKSRRLKGMMSSEYALFGATEIDYEIPDFEAISGLQSQFVQSESGIYRLGYMDFYQAPLEKPEVNLTEMSRKEEVLPTVVPIDDVHFMRCLESVNDPGAYPMRITVARRGIDHLKSLHQSCIAWTTRNLEVRTSSDGHGKEVSSLAQLVSYVADRDKDSNLKVT